MQLPAARLLPSGLSVPPEDFKLDCEAYFIEDGLATCKVGYLPKHLAFRADRYDGLCARILEVYSSDKAETDCVAKRQKYHRKCGCCVAVIVGMKDMFAIK
jgi:hypothetical protein